MSSSDRQRLWLLVICFLLGIALAVWAQVLFAPPREQQWPTAIGEPWQYPIPYRPRSAWPDVAPTIGPGIGER